MNRRDSTSSTDSWSIVHNRSAKEDDIVLGDNDTSDDASDILDSDIEIAEEAYNSYDDSDIEITDERSDDEEAVDSESEIEQEEQQDDQETDSEEEEQEEEAVQEEHEAEETDSEVEESQQEQEEDSDSESEDEVAEEGQKPEKWCSIEDTEALADEGKYFANPEKVKEKLNEFDCSPFDDWCLFVSRNKRVLATVIFQITLVVAVSAAVPMGMKLFADWMDEQIRSNCESVKVTELSGLQSRWQSSIFIQDHRKRNAVLPTFNASVLDEMRNLRKTRQVLRVQPRKIRSIPPSKQISFVPERQNFVKPSQCPRSVVPTKALIIAPTVVTALRPVLSNDTVIEPCGIRRKRRLTPIPCKGDTVIVPEFSQRAVKAVTYTITSDSNLHSSRKRRLSNQRPRNVRHTCPRHSAPTSRPVAAPPLTPPSVKPRTRHTSPLPPPSNIRHTPAKWHTGKKSSSLSVLPKETSLRVLPKTTRVAPFKSWRTAQKAQRTFQQVRNVSAQNLFVSPIWPMDIFPGMSLFRSRKSVQSVKQRQAAFKKIEYYYCSYGNKSLPLYCPAQAAASKPSQEKVIPRKFKLNPRKINRQKSWTVLEKSQTCGVPPVSPRPLKQLPMIPPRKLINLQKKQGKSSKTFNVSKKSQTCGVLPVKESGLVKYQKEAKKVVKAMNKMDMKKKDLKVLLHNYQTKSDCKNVIQKVMKMQKKMKKNSEEDKKSKLPKLGDSKKIKPSGQFDFDAKIKRKLAKCAG